MNDPCIIVLNKEERQFAWDYHNKVVSKVSKNPNYTGLETRDRYFVGKCGEIATAKWAKEKGILCEDTTNDDGIPDDQDVVFPDRGVTVNVKNSHHPRAKYLMQPIAQRQRHTQDFLFGATGTDNGEEVTVLLWGAVTDLYYEKKARYFSDMQSPCLAMLLDKLPLSILDFENLLKREGQWATVNAEA